VRPYVESHGGRLEVLNADGGVVTVRLSGACQGCSGSAATLRHVVEQALRDGLVDFVRMEVDAPAPAAPSNFISIASLLAQDTPRLDWRPVLRTDDLSDGSLRGVDVGGERVLLVNRAGEYYAYRNACPGTPFPLDGGQFQAGVILCPWHGCRFDARGGKRLDDSGPGLGVVPIAVEAGEIRIGILGKAAA